MKALSLLLRIFRRKETANEKTIYDDCRIGKTVGKKYHYPTNWLGNVPQY